MGHGQGNPDAFHPGTALSDVVLLGSRNQAADYFDVPGPALCRAATAAEVMGAHG